MHGSQRHAALSLLPLLLCLVAGCGGGLVRLEMGPLPQSPAAGRGTIVVSDIDAPKDENQIGAHTFTLFAIPVAPIRTTEPYGPKLDGFVKDALQRAGYTCLSSPQTAGRGTPRVGVTVKRFNFITYMWFWPLVLGGGDCDIRIWVMDADGKVVWERTFKKYANAASIGYFGGESMTNVVKTAITGCLQQVADGAISAEFEAALRQAGGPPPGQWASRDLAPAPWTIPGPSAGANSGAQRAVLPPGQQAGTGASKAASQGRLAGSPPAAIRVTGRFVKADGISAEGVVLGVFEATEKSYKFLPKVNSKGERIYNPTGRSKAGGSFTIEFSRDLFGRAKDLVLIELESPDGQVQHRSDGKPARLSISKKSGTIDLGDVTWMVNPTSSQPN